jgi:hypothetical protein
MKDTTFNYIWDEIILKNIIELESAFDADEKRKYGFHIRDLKLLKRNICVGYNVVKNDLKKNYYDMSSEIDSRIDNHKIATCLCYSLIQNKVFDFIVDKDMPKRMFSINYELAYTVSLGFIYATLIAQYKRNNQYDLAEKLIKQGKLYVPETSAEHDEYHVGRIHTLALNDIYGNSFDVLTYSDMMFWIEYYNRQLLENTLTPMSLRTK